MRNNETMHFDTAIIHAGRNPEFAATPIHMAATSNRSGGVFMPGLHAMADPRVVEGGKTVG